TSSAVGPGACDLELGLRREAALPGEHQRILGVDRAREMIALHVAAPGDAQRLELGRGLDALGDHFHAERTAEMNHRMDDRRALALAAHAIDEAAIDLKTIAPEASDSGDRRIAG